MKKVPSRAKDYLVILLIIICAAAMGTVRNKIQVQNTNQTEVTHVMISGLSAWGIFKAVVAYAWESTRPEEIDCKKNGKYCQVVAGTER